MNEKKAVEKQFEAQQPYEEMSDQSLAFDTNASDNPMRPSDINPEDYYSYKRFVNLPESQSEFSTKIDKDVVFANLGGSKPSREELLFQVGTIELFESEFVIEKEVYVVDKEGRIMFEEIVGPDGKKTKSPLKTKIKIFDEEFRGILNYLKAEYKFDIVASRAIGDKDRAAYLDISSANRISKEFQNKKNQGQSKFGFGG